MTEILQIFTGNPLATFIGKKIEAATRLELEADDWALNLEICDLINENDDDAKDAIRAIKKRLQSVDQDKDFAVTNRTLTVLETCVSNCSHRFHVLVMTKDFIQELIKLIGPKNNPPIALQERVLSMIDRWAEAFRSQPDLGGVVAVCQDLRAKGVTFPARDPGTSVPIQTPQRSVARAASPPVSRTIQAPQSRAPNPTAQPSGQVVLEGEGYNKISQDLTVVQSSIEMFTDILKLLETPKSEETDWNLALELYNTCKQMQRRIVDLIAEVANEDLTIEMLRLNDDLNNIFTKYDNLASKRPGQTAPQPPAEARQRATPQAGDSRARPGGLESELSLIDFNASVDALAGAKPIQPALSPKQADVPPSSSSKAVVADPFDSSLVEAALTKISTKPGDASTKPKIPVESMSQLNLGKSNPKQGGLPEEVSSVREQDFAEIADWLSKDSGQNVGMSTQEESLEPISIPNTEFDRFIESRALAGSSSATASQSKKPEPST